jgi:hypothetical protein
MYDKTQNTKILHLDFFGNDTIFKKNKKFKYYNKTIENYTFKLYCNFDDATADTYI